MPKIVKNVLKEFDDGWINYPGVGKITDEAVAKFVKQHTHWWTRLNYNKMVRAGLIAQNFLMKVFEPPKCKKWYF